MYIYIDIFVYISTVYVCCRFNIYIFTENRNRKLKFAFLSRQTINGNRSLLFQQRCPSLHIPHVPRPLIYLCIYIILISSHLVDNDLINQKVNLDSTLLKLSLQQNVLSQEDIHQVSDSARPPVGSCEV